MDFDYFVMMHQIYKQLDKEPKELAEIFNISLERAAELIVLADAVIEENEPRRKLITSYMHYAGDNYSKLNATEQWQIYCEADGFGRLASDDLSTYGWDYSHIRDSSIAGWKRMEQKLNYILESK